MRYNELSTEIVNTNTHQIDICSTEDIIALINSEDKMVAFEVEKAKSKIAEAVDAIVDRLSQGGRLIYVGAGTSGRIGILDASECPPTYGTEPELVSCLMAGGKDAFFCAKENFEDNYELGRYDVHSENVCSSDVVVGISASGSAQYVIGALVAAGEKGARTISVCNVKNSKMSQACSIAIEVVTGAEAIMGSTRMKAGTAQKMVLNMLTTASMIKLGKVYKNLMVDLKASNGKLKERKVRIVMLAADVSYDTALKALEKCSQDTKSAIVSSITNSDYETAMQSLNKNNGFVRNAIDYIISRQEMI